MLFPTIEFAIFFIVVFYFSWELDLFPRERKYFLLAASYFFYSTLDFRFLPILILSPCFNYVMGLIVGDLSDKKLKKAVLGFAIAGNVALLGVFKYYDFFLENILNLLSAVGLDLSNHTPPAFMNFVLPLGISFFTFQGISYIVDIYRGELHSRNSLLDVLLYISFFPHLVAGPIVKASEFIPQLARPVDRTKIPFAYATILILLGLFKKVVIANYLGSDLVDPVFESPTRFSNSDVVLATYGYAVQIFCDFSAYSDMAIGFAALLGYEFPINFRQPYRAQSLQEFWRRWHISLSSWLRDYVFISLGGSKEGERKTYRNLTITMLLGGLWHGASWNFIFWGALHGLGLTGERLYKARHPAKNLWWQKLASGLVTFHFVCFAWIFFRASSFELAWSMIGQLFDFKTVAHYTNFFYPALILLGMSFHFLPPLEKFEVPQWIGKAPAFSYLIIAGLFISFVAMLAPDGIPAFIYFRF